MNSDAASTPTPPLPPQETSAVPDDSARAYLPPHIIVLVHGNNGAPEDFDAFERTLLRKFGAAQVLTIKSAANHTQTALGVEIGGTRLAEEVYRTIFQYELHPDVDCYKLSIVAHSLGGLYARYAIVQLMTSLAPLNMTYVSFVTLCTPHLGSRRPRGDSTLKNVWRVGVHTVLGSRTLYGQTGIDLLVDVEKAADDANAVECLTSSDANAPVPPLLEVMCKPDSEFVSALQQFCYGTLVAMTDGDVVVPYASASIRNFNPYPSAALTDMYSDWRWHVHHSGFVSASTPNDKRHAAFLQRLASHVDSDAVVADDPLRGLDVTTSERFASVDGYDADNKQEVEFTFDMIASLQQAMAWRRLDVTVEPLGVKGKLRLHDWPIAKMQPPGCRALEFIDLVCDMIGCDHALDVLPPRPDESANFSDDEPNENELHDGLRGRIDASFVGAGITRLIERFQHSRSPSRSSSEDGVGSAQLSPFAAGSRVATTAESSPTVSDSSARSSLVGAANGGLQRLLGKFQRKDSSPSTAAVSASLAPATDATHTTSIRACESMTSIDAVTSSPRHSHQHEQFATQLDTMTAATSVTAVVDVDGVEHQ